MNPPQPHHVSPESQDAQDEAPAHGLIARSNREARAFARTGTAASQAPAAAPDTEAPETDGAAD